MGEQMSLPLCPKHKVPLLPEGSQVLYCPDPSCCHATTRAALGLQASKPKKGGTLSSFPTGPKVKILEKDLQIEVAATLSVRGYEVMETGRTRSLVTCEKCGQKNYAAGWQGNTPSLPDLQIRNPKWSRGMWLDIELKGSDTRVTEGQQALCDRGGSYICRSWEEVWKAVCEIEGEREAR